MSKAAEFSYRRHDAERVVEAVVSTIGVPDSLLDLGGGIGLWADEFKKRGSRRAIVIDHDQEPGEILVSQDEFRDFDLAWGMPDPAAVDLAICLEVAEHLPAGVADALVAFLTECAPMILFSAAVPGQQGNGHINCQPPLYWEQKFGAKDYCRFDVIRPLVLHDDSVSYWYRQNAFLFVRSGHPQAERLRIQRGAVPAEFELLHRKIAERYWAEPGVRALLKALPGAVGRVAKRRFGNAGKCSAGADPAIEPRRDCNVET